MPGHALNRFGSCLMHEVRDEAIDHWLLTLGGKMNDEKSKEIYATLTQSQRELLEKFVPDIVDTTLHFLLCMLQWHDDIMVNVDCDGERVNDLKVASDDLAGELYTKRGWIACFSKRPSSWTQE